MFCRSGQPASRWLRGLVFLCRPQRKSLSETPWTIHRGSSLSFPRRRLAWNLSARMCPSWEQVGFTSRPGFLATVHFLDIASPAVLTAEHGPARGPSRMRSDVQTAGSAPASRPRWPEWLAASWQPEPRPDPAEQGGSERAYLVLAHAFTYTEPGGKLELSTEELLRSSRPASSATSA